MRKTMSIKNKKAVTVLAIDLALILSPLRDSSKQLNSQQTLPTVNDLQSYILIRLYQ
jgi:hypothetical protein